VRARVLRAGMVAALALGGVAVQATPASAAGNGVDVESYCQWKYGWHADLVNWNVYGWMCNPVPGNEYYRQLWRLNNQGNVDMVKQCQRQGWHSATYADYNNPYSWYCI
jgi:hypothetical protein